MARPVSPWLDGTAPVGPPLAGHTRADVVIVGAGFTGLWTALTLTERDPSLQVVVLEAAVVGHGASGRNGGFVDASLTHGVHHGLANHAEEFDELARLGAENLAELTAFVRTHDLDVDLEPVGEVTVATEPWQLEDLADGLEAYERAGEKVRLLDADEVRAQLDSPTYLGGLVREDGAALVDPGRLVHALARLAGERGVVIHEGSPVTQLAAHGTGVVARTPGGQVVADRAVIATNAYSHRLLPRLGRWFVPVSDQVLLTAPLTDTQLARIGWDNRQGFGDAANLFHYYRLTPDQRILWGGYDVIYRYGGKVGPAHDHHRATYDALAAGFRRTFPQLDDVPFERAWGGPVATTTRFSVAFGEELGGRAVWALGYTGLGVAATRFAARVLSDRLLAPDSALLELRFTSTRPVPFPPEPLRWAVVEATRRAMHRSDAREGRRGWWLGTLDRIGIGLDA